MRIWTSGTLLVLGALALACGGGGNEWEGRGGYGGYGGWGDNSGGKHDTRTLVGVETIALGSVSDFLVTSSSVESEAQVDLSPETTGRVIEIRAEEGERVQRGQVLAVLENASLDASYERASAEFDRARVNAKELEELESVGAVSSRELAEAQYTLATARATRDEAEKSQGFTRIVSPIAGTVSARDVRYGEIASAGTRSFQVVDLARLRVVVQLPERDLSRVSEGQQVLLAPTYDDAVEVKAEVLRVSPVVDAASGTVRVTIALSPDEVTIRPGQFVSVRIEVGRHDDTVVVPREAVLYDEGDPYVFVLIDAADLEKDDDEGERKSGGGERWKGKKDKEGGFFARFFGGGEDDKEDEDKEDAAPEGPQRAVKRVAIETGFMELSRAEVVSGLSVGQQVVTVGHETLRDEAKVRLEGDPVYTDDDEEQDASEESGESDDKKNEDEGGEATG